MSQKPIILIAEDDPRVRELLKAAFQDEYGLLFAKDGLETMDLLHTHSPDLILMDILMPKLNGWQAIREIRALRNTVPIIVITGHPDPYNQFKAERLGVVDCLAKPFDLAHLQQLIRQEIKGP